MQAGIARAITQQFALHHAEMLNRDDAILAAVLCAGQFVVSGVAISGGWDEPLKSGKLLITQGVFYSRQRQMRRVRAVFGWEALLCQQGGQVLLKSQQARCIARYPDPDDTRAAWRAKRAQRTNTQGERFLVYCCVYRRLGSLIKLLVIQLSKEGEGQVQGVGVYPAQVWQGLCQSAQFAGEVIAGFIPQLNSDKCACHIATILGKDGM